MQLARMATGMLGVQQGHRAPQRARARLPAPHVCVLTGACRRADLCVLARARLFVLHMCVPIGAFTARHSPE